jgi:hypothetical protein
VVENNLDARKFKRNRWLAFGIMLIPLAVISAASLLWLAVEKGYIDIVGSLGTHNNGALLQPAREFESIAVYTADKKPFVYSAQPAKWTLLIPGGASCDDDCQQTLWLTRQLHTALGRRAVHFRRIYLSDSGPPEPKFAALLARDYPGLELLYCEPGAIDSLLGSVEGGSRAVPPDHYYLIDKRGFVMMEYTPRHTGKDVIADLKFLMKQVGDE